MVNVRWVGGVGRDEDGRFSQAVIFLHRQLFFARQLITSNLSFLVTLFSFRPVLQSAWEYYFIWIYVMSLTMRVMTFTGSVKEMWNNSGK